MLAAIAAIAVGVPLAAALPAGAFSVERYPAFSAFDDDPTKSAQARCPDDWRVVAAVARSSAGQTD